MSKKIPLFNHRKPTQRDLDNLGRYRAMEGSGSRSGSQQVRTAPPAHKEKDLLRSNSGATPELKKEELSPEQMKVQRNEQEKERRLRAMQDRLEVINELKESGYLIHKINV